MRPRFILFPALLALSALVRPAGAYTLTGAHWYSSTVTMQLQLGATTGQLTDGSTSWGASAEDALSIWNNYMGGMRFAVVRDSTAGKSGGNRINNVFFDNAVYGQAWGTGVLAITLTYTSNGSQTTETDVIFNTGMSWDSYRGSQRYSSGSIYDFHRVALHEFGHVLGLDHPDQAGQSVTAIMNSRITNLDSLVMDDISGAQSIYGASSTTVAQPPVIMTQPASQSVMTGSNVSFSVGASSSTALTYRWNKDGVALSGATASTLALTNVPTSAAGAYTVTVSNSAGSTTSAGATLSVSSPPPPAPAYAPSITSQPAGRIVGAGQSATFAVAASGTSPFSYLWRKDGSPISGATQSAYTISSVKATDAGNYSVVVANSIGSATSGSASLIVTAGPAIAIQPASQNVNAGSALTLSISASGIPAPTFQWFKDGTAINGATSATFTIASVRTTDAGTYTVVVSNSTGTVTSATAQVTVNTPPVVALAPTGQTVVAGARVVLSVAASGSPAPSFQWQKNGMNIAGATQAELVIGAAAATDSGTYSVVVTNTAGSVATVPVLLTVNFSQLVNLSTRGFVPPGGALTAGFVLRGSQDKPVLVRGIGPALYDFGVSGALSDPRLAVIAQDSSQTLAVNDSWSAVPQISTTFQSVGAFALPVGSADSASQLRLPAGAYTTRVTSEGATNGGVALAEVYDADAASVRCRLVNLSTLGYAGTGDNTLVAGFSVQGNAPKRVLIRAVGPGLAPYGVSAALANPKLEVYPLGQSSPVGANDDWGGGTVLQNAFTAAGAFGLATGSRDAALVLSLPPGAYTVIVSGTSGTTGYVLAEIYDLDP